MNWKGESASYSAKHNWVLRNAGKANHCSMCGDTSPGNRKYDWANISGEYKRDLSDYKPLCKKCHRIFDQKPACKRGHLLEGKNVRIYKTHKYKARYCRTCKREREYKYILFKQLKTFSLAELERLIGWLDKHAESLQKKNGTKAAPAY